MFFNILCEKQRKRNCLSNRISKPWTKTAEFKNNRFADYVNIIMDLQQLHTKRKISSTLFQQWNYNVKSWLSFESVFLYVKIYFCFFSHICIRTEKDRRDNMITFHGIYT